MPSPKKSLPKKAPSSTAAHGWLVKQEPAAYAWDTFLKDGRTTWDGVRNFQARNNLRAMKVGDPVFFYASVTGKEIQGLAEVSKAAYPDPTAEEGEWYSVELKAKRPLKKPVPLDAMKTNPKLANFLLVRHSRLSVMPVSAEEFTEILRLAGE